MPRLPSIRFFHREAYAAGAALTTEAGWSGAGRGWRKELRWVCILLIVWVTCDLTLGASITSLLTCLRFGWGDWVAGRWLRKKDPLRTRGRACGCFYLASAVLKVAIAAFIGSFIFIVLESAILKLGEPTIDFILLMCCALLGFLLTGLLATLGTMTAWRHRHRVWVDAAVHFSRERGIWPPCALDANSARTLVTAATIFWLALLMIVALFALLAPVNVQGQPRDGSWLALAVIAGMIGGPIAMLVLRNIIARRIVAASPHDCWPEVPVSWFGFLAIVAGVMDLT